MNHNFDFEEQSPVNPFKVPEGYFEDFAARMETLTTPKKLSFTQKYRTYIYAAAVALLLVTVGTFLFVSVNNKPQQQIAESKVSEYDEALKDILIEETTQDMVIDYILAEAE